jgi:hypothetical protein
MVCESRDSATFKPDKLDGNQWMEAAAAAGKFRYGAASLDQNHQDGDVRNQGREVVELHGVEEFQIENFRTSAFRNSLIPQSAGQIREEGLEILDFEWKWVGSCKSKIGHKKC